jgi:hypothetical protein
MNANDFLFDRTAWEWSEFVLEHRHEPSAKGMWAAERRLAEWAELSRATSRNSARKRAVLACLPGWSYTPLDGEACAQLNPDILSNGWAARDNTRARWCGGDAVARFRPFDLAADEGIRWTLRLETGIISDEVTSAFEMHGNHDGSGYDWDELAVHLMARFEPDLVDEFECDSESGWFEAEADDPAVLLRLAELLTFAYYNLDHLRASLAELWGEDR